MISKTFLEKTESAGCRLTAKRGILINSCQKKLKWVDFATSRKVNMCAVRILCRRTPKITHMTKCTCSCSVKGHDYLRWWFTLFNNFILWIAEEINPDFIYFTWAFQKNVFHKILLNFIFSPKGSKLCSSNEPAIRFYTCIQGPTTTTAVGCLRTKLFTPKTASHPYEMRCLCMGDSTVFIHSLQEPSVIASDEKILVLKKYPVSGRA